MSAMHYHLVRLICFPLIFILIQLTVIVLPFWFPFNSLLSEQCDDRWVTQDISGLENDLHSNVFGQELAVDVIVTALGAHVNQKDRKKPLVLNFHGWPGGGKGYVAEFILKHWYKEGSQSKFVKKYVSRLDFTVISELHNYQKKLQQDLEETIERCPRAMFVFDEVDKYIPGVLDGIKPYLDYSSNVNGHDFREAVFIFITNNGDKLITNIALDNLKKGNPREKLKLQDFELVLKQDSFNDNVGGFYHSDLIKHHLIDMVVPFLPLEHSHVVSCIKAEFYLEAGDTVDSNFVMRSVSEILEEMTFSPPDLELYSVNGCKSVSEKVGEILERERRKLRKRRSEF